MRSLPYAIRGWTVRADAKAKTKDPNQPTATHEAVELPNHALVIDTETSLDPTQRLLFGCFRYLRRDTHGVWHLYTEGLIHADDLPEADLETLRTYRESHRVAFDVNMDTDGHHEPNPTLELLSRTEFVKKWWHRVGVPNDGLKEPPAVMVFFNAPFDISRLASEVADARGDMYGGFSFQVMAAADGSRLKMRPDVVVKSIDSKRSLMSNRSTNERGAPRRAGYRGHYLDLKAAVFGLTAEGKTLDSACKAYGVEGKSTPVLGVVSPEAIDYCRHDVKITAQLFTKVVEDFETHDIDLQLTKVYSPASIAKAYLKQMGIKPLLGDGGAGARTPPEVLGIAMSAFYGGRAECHIRRTEVPVVLVDFTSMYPSVNALMGSWDLITAESIDVVRTEANTGRVRALVEQMVPADVYDPTLWAELLTLVQIQPDDDLLPIRASYRDGDWSIGINYFTTPRPLWYTLADVLAAKLLTGKAPTILDAITFTPVGQAAGLKPVKLRGITEIDPATTDFFTTVIEERAPRKKQYGDNDPLQLFLKIIANAGGYGIFAQMTPEDRPATNKAKVQLYAGRETDPTPVEVISPETPGEFCYPPLAACITGTARLMLAAVEYEVAALGGEWAMCDTDSMAIVATPNGGELIPCEGGTHTNDHGQAYVRALSYADVEAIRRKFDRLNPYDPDVIPDLLKEDKAGQCIAVSAKRYVIFTDNPTAEDGLDLSKASEHGLGHLINPLDEDPDAEIGKGDSGARPWVEDVWRAIIRRTRTGQRIELPTWAERPAHTRITVSSPMLLKPFTNLNTNPETGQPKAYRDRIKPANFMVTATLDPFYPPRGINTDEVRLVAPYTRSAVDQTEWINIADPTMMFTVTTPEARRPPGSVVLKTYGRIIREYSNHPEEKFIGADGQTCRLDTVGLLRRDHINGTVPSVIGKEANNIEGVESGLLAPEDVTTAYEDGNLDHLRNHVLPALFGAYSGHQIAKLIGANPTSVNSWKRGATPQRRHRRRLLDLATSIQQT